MITVHLSILILTAIAILIADKDGMDWMRGKKETLSEKRVSYLHKAVFVGLFLMIGTGLSMAYNTIEWYIKDPTFILKMLFVATLVINGFFIGAISKVATISPFNKLEIKMKRKLIISGTVSAFSWIGATTCGLLL